MTVFKAFLTITKRNLGIVFLYLIIFFVIGLMAVSMLSSDSSMSFQRESLDIAVIDRDGGALAQGLADYLGTYHNLKDIPDDADILQDRLFYREIYYVVTIPENFEDKCLNGNEKLPVTKVPGSVSGYYVDQQINTFLNDVRIMEKGGFTVSEAVSHVIDNLNNTPSVTLIDKMGNGGTISTHAFMYQYLPYVLMSIICYTVSYIMIAFGNPDLKKRMLCSAVSGRSMNTQLFLGYTVIGIAVWAIFTLISIAMYRKDFLTDPCCIYYLMNSLIVTVVSLSISFLLSAFITRDELVSAVVNVVTLGMSFSCGVFVSLDILSKGMKTVAHFLPVYWYEIANNLLAGNRTLSSTQLVSLYQAFAIQLLFAAAFLAAALVFRRNRARAEG